MILAIPSQLGPAARGPTGSWQSSPSSSAPSPIKASCLLHSRYCRVTLGDIAQSLAALSVDVPSCVSLSALLEDFFTAQNCCFTSPSSRVSTVQPETACGAQIVQCLTGAPVEK